MVAPLIAALLAIPAGERYPAIELSPQQQKERTFQALVDQLAGLASRQPMLAVYEDVQWSDPTTLELLEKVVERVQRLAVLVLITFRPEFTPPWRGQTPITSLALNRLSRKQGAAMVAEVTGGRELPAAVLEEIVSKTDGVPLFVEELTKAVVESGLLEDESGRYTLTGPLPPLAIPTTLHDSLLARLDRLAPAKEAAQIGAAIGREFSYELLAAVAPLGHDELHNGLNRPVEAELIFRQGTLSQATYNFKHALEPAAIPAASRRAERRQLTVLFCDLVGSTELSARLDPEDLREVIGPYQAACARVIARFDGHVARFLGDGVLAYFGWPRAHEDDAERAVRAGLAMVVSIDGLAVGAEVPLAARVGIATGRVMVGDLET